MADQNQELQDIMHAVSYELEKFGKVTGTTADALRDAEVGVKGFSNAVRTAPKAIGDAATGMAKAMYNGEKGAAAFNKSIDSMAQAADSAVTVLMALIPGGPVVKAVVAGLGLLAKAIIKTAAEAEKLANLQGDALYNTYQKLGKAGAAAAGGTTQLGQDLYKLGLGFQEADQMVSLLTDNSQDLALFGKTVFQGADAMVSIVNAAKPYRDQLQRLGLNQAEQNEAIMGYIKIQTRIGNAGRLQAQGYEATAAAAAKYIAEQDALTKVTGISRKEQEKAMEEAMRNQRFAATVDQLIAEGKTAEAENLRVMVQASAKLGPQFQKGMTDIVSGFANTDEARQVLLATQGDALKQIDLVKQGLSKAPGEIDKSMQSIFNNTAEFSKNMRPLAQAGALDKLAGSYYELRRATELEGGKFTDAMGEARAASVKQLEGADKRLKNQSEAAVAQQDAMLATQQMVDKGITPATTATLALANNAKLAAEKLNELAGSVEKQLRAQKDADAKVEYDKAMQGASFMQKHLGVGQTPDQKAATERYQSQQRGGMSFDPNSGELTVDEGGGPPSVKATDFVKFSSGTGDEAHFKQLEPAVQQAFLKMAQNYNNLTGDKLQVNSGFRSPNEQASVDSGSNPKAAPGMSLHQAGRAIDINSDQRNKLEAMGLLTQSGFKSLVGDPPHIFMKDGGLLTGPESGYKPNLVAHGTEAVIPLKNGAVPVSLSSNLGGEIRQALLEGMRQMSESTNVEVLAMLGELVREQKIANGINQKILTTSRN